VVTASGGLTFGQVSLWRDIEHLSTDRWHEANLVRSWQLRPAVSADALHAAVVLLAERHEGLRTRFNFRTEQQNVSLRVEPPLTDLTVLTEPARDAFAYRPFDLEHEIGWRIGFAVTPTSTTVVAVVHHLIADGYGLGILQSDLTELARGGNVATGVGPLELLAAETSTVGDRRAKAAIVHWESALDRLGNRGSLPQPSKVPLCHVELMTGLSRASLTARLPEHVSLMALILAAFVEEVSGEPASASGDELFVRMMISNRTSPERRRAITTMNEWVAAIVPSGRGAAGTETAPAIAMAVRVGLRHGIYSVDRLAEVLRERGLTTTDMDNTLSYNYVDVEHERFESPSRPSGVITVDDVGITIGPRAYLRALLGADLLLSLRVPNTSPSRAWAERVLTGMRSRLGAVDAAADVDLCQRSDGH